MAHGHSETDARHCRNGHRFCDSYKGGSVGVYVKDVLDDQAAYRVITSGHFSADVELTATFGGGNVPANDQFTITGTITGSSCNMARIMTGRWLGLADFSGRMGRNPGESPATGFTNTFSGVATVTARLPLVRGG